MGTGYVRQSAADIVAGNTVEATPLNNEFNAIRDAFSGTIGHSHDATTGNGPKIDLATSVTGVLAIANGGMAVKHKTDGTTAPTVNEDTGDGYGPGSIWVDTTNDKVYMNVDGTAAAAVWIYIGDATGAWQPRDADLTALAGLTSAANKLPYFTGSGTAALTDLTTYVRTLLDDADASAFLTTLGISSFAQSILDDASAGAVRTTIGAQAQDGDLDALAALTGTNTIYYRSAANTWTAVTIGGNLTFTSGTLDAVAAALDPTLDAIAGLSTVADKSIYFTGVDAAATYDLTSFARTLLDDVDAATARGTLGLTIGTNVQAYDADLAAIAGLTSAANKGIYFTGAGTAATFDLTAFARTILDDANGADVLTTIGGAPLASPTFTGTPAAPTAAVTVDTTQLATTAFVHDLQTPQVVSASPSSNQNDYAISGGVSVIQKTILVLTPTISIKLTGVSTSGWVTGKELVIRNGTSEDGADSRLIILELNSTSSSAANRFGSVKRKIPVMLMPGDEVNLRFDGTNLKVLDHIQSSPTTHMDTGNGAGGSVSGTGAAIDTTGYRLDNDHTTPAFQLSTGTTTTGRAVAMIGGAGGVTGGEGAILYLANLALTQLSTAGQEFDVNVGFHDTAAGLGTPGDGLFWTYDRNTSTNWYCKALSNSVATTVDSGIAASTSTTLIRLGVFLNGDATRGEFFYSTDMGQTWTFVSTAITTNLPNARTFGAETSIVKSAGTTAVTLYLAYQGFRNLNWS